LKCGLLGKKLSHSYSPLIHSFFGDYEYKLYEVLPENLDEFFKTADFDGLNVTIPYKEAVMKYCDRIDERALRIGAVNTLVSRNGELVGYNTDYMGFESLITRFGDVRGKKVLVLGSGGASKTACAVIEDLGGKAVVISRSGGVGHNYETVALHCLDTDVIVNTTPVGMYPNTLVSPLDISDFINLSGVADVIYNPSKTKLLLDAEKMDVPVNDGLCMLIVQAYGAYSLWCENPVEYDLLGIETKIGGMMKNIVLVGMPGSGKTTVGRMAARKFNREFVDCDEEFFKVYNKTPAEVIVNEGEAEFRRLETELLREICKKSSLVISTGGGAVTVEENLDIIRQNAVVYCIKRDINKLSKDNRPLSVDLYAMYEKRAPLYSGVSDVTVLNNGKIEDAVRGIKV